MKMTIKTALLVLITLLAFGPTVHAEESPLSKQFDEHYKRLLSLADKRKDADTYTQQLKGVWLGTRKELLVIDADIEARKLEATVYSGAEQQKIMDELIAMSGERERLLINGIQKLNKLEGGEKVDIPSRSFRQQADARVNPAGQIVDDGKGGTLFGNIRIDIAPEDVGKNIESNPGQD